ncbi:MAG TPA: DUF3093 family protein [Dehalococcoidia bacterium]|nr:DUF3093 family protein [Dehalococcoidia bacterium]
MPPKPIYEEKLKANSTLVAGVLLWGLVVGVIPGAVIGGLWWLFALYIALVLAILYGFYQLNIELFEDRLVVRFGFLYRKVIEVEKIKDCSPHKVLHPVRTYGGWGIRKGTDGTFALTQAFINQAVKLETPERTFVISTHKPESLCEAIKALKG